MTPSTSSLHIGSEQKLRDLYPNIRVTVTSPRKIFFKRVNYDNNKIKLVSLIHLIIQLPFNYTELEHRRLFRIFVTNSRKKDEQREVQVYARKSSTMADFLAEIKQWMPTLCSEKGSQQLR